jgi:diguanylate cyclase (GGDEF)-like protein
VFLFGKKQRKAKGSGLAIVPGRIARLAFLLAIGLTALSTLALVLVGSAASDEAGRLARVGEKALLNNVLNEQFTGMIRDQQSLARWNTAMQQMMGRSKEDFVRNEMAKALWTDFGFEQSFLVDSTSHALVKIDKDTVIFGPSLRDVPIGVLDLAHETVQNRPSKGRTKGITRNYAPAFDNTHSSYASIDGKVAMLSAMVIEPGDASALGLSEGGPVVLVSAKFINQAMLQDINSTLKFESLTFAASLHAQDCQGDLSVLNIHSAPLGKFYWRSPSPGNALWSMIIPMIIVTALVFTAIAFWVAVWIGRISQKLEQSEHENKILALHDGLTGISNRLHFERLLAQALENADHKPLAMVACDLDRFKPVNDRFGHAAGDCVIRAVADRLSACVKGQGVVGRIGGDEFAILIDGYADPPRLSILMQQIIDAIGQPIAIGNGIDATVGISLGVAIATPQIDREALLHKADEALYRAKEKGRGCAVFAHQIEMSEKEPPPSSADHNIHAA